MQLVSINRKCVQIPGDADLQWSRSNSRKEQGMTEDYQKYIITNTRNTRDL